MNCFNKNKQLVWRFCALALLLFALLNCSNSYAQTNDSLWEVYADRNIDPSITLHRHKTESTFRAEFHPFSQDTAIIRHYEATNDIFSFNAFMLSHPSSFAYIQYLNDSTWYLFGNRCEIATYPFLFKTTNAGLSWETIIQAWPNNFSFPQMSTLFRMYDMTHGIWVIGLESNKLKYRITEDGGYTWEDKRIRVKRLYKRIGMHTHIQLSFNGNSTKIFLNNTRVFRNGNLYESKNYGRKFKKLN